MSYPFQHDGPSHPNVNPRVIHDQDDDGYPDEDGDMFLNSRIKGLEALQSPEPRHKVLPWLDDVPHGKRPDDERSFAGGSVRTGGILKRELNTVLRVSRPRFRQLTAVSTELYLQPLGNKCPQTWRDLRLRPSRLHQRPRGEPKSSAWRPHSSHARHRYRTSGKSPSRSPTYYINWMAQQQTSVGSRGRSGNNVGRPVGQSQARSRRQERR